MNGFLLVYSFCLVSLTSYASKIFLVGSWMIINPKSPAAIPKKPMILKVHLQPNPVIITIVNEDKAPPK